MRLIHETDNSEALHKSFNASDTLFITQYKYANFHLRARVFVASAHGRDVYPTFSVEGFN